MEQQKILTALASDTFNGLTANPKYLLSKYFYDDAGSALFQKIMTMPEYYLTRCEEEILNSCKTEITDAIIGDDQILSLVELGSGDGQKTKILLQELIRKDIKFQYVPLDISKKANDMLTQTLKSELPELVINAMTGDYFDRLRELNGYASKRKIILFLGSNIGNFSDTETYDFLNRLAEFTNQKDKLLIGFDLKKSPEIIMDAYNDPHGFTRNFNLNLLVRLNRELQADFRISQFEQHTEYNPQTGEVMSFLVSKKNQSVYISALEHQFHFDAWEPVFVERSCKYDLHKIERLAAEHGFRVVANFTDSRNYFIDSLWEKL